ncbi:MAG TPA: nuclear transport factor 2 family protein [Streptosporangiaceae bacterium]|nr:nuclear transport factor 2 family protein [Streptosporangiaceae bacterium]
MPKNHELEAEILDLGQQWAKAELLGDTEALADLLADDFVGVGPRGFLLNKQAWLARYSSGTLRHEQFTWRDVDVRGYGDTAVAVGTEESRGSYGDRPITGQLRGTHLLVRDGGRWKIAGMHLSPTMS